MASPIGLSVEEALERVLRGEPGDGRVPAYELTGVRSPKNLKYLSPASRHLMWAGLRAAEQSGWTRETLTPARTAVFTGSGQTGLEPSQMFPGFKVAQTPEGEADWAALGGAASRLLDAYFPLRSLSNSGLALLAMDLGAQGPTNNFVQSDTAGVQALDAATGALQEGTCDVAVCGAFDSLLTPANDLNYRRAGLVSARGRMTPFSPDADGVVLAEGAAALVLERRADAVARGAAALARVAVGEGDGPDFVVAAGHAVPELDREEAESIGPGLERVAFKGATGYVGAATALMELALAIALLRARALHRAVCRSRSWMGEHAAVTVDVPG